MSSAALKTFETQKIMQVVNDDTMSEEKKIELFRTSFKSLSDATLGTISDSISRIDSVNGSTDNPKFIKEFIDNTDKEIFNKIQAHLEKLKDINAIKPMVVEVTEEMREKGIKTDTVEVPITFDPSTFFV
jgi:F0F1-type ATP synthase delta subunit